MEEKNKINAVKRLNVLNGMINDMQKIIENQANSFDSLPEESKTKILDRYNYVKEVGNNTIENEFEDGENSYLSIYDNLSPKEISGLQTLLQLDKLKDLTPTLKNNEDYFFERKQPLQTHTQNETSITNDRKEIKNSLAQLADSVLTQTQELGKLAGNTDKIEKPLAQNILKTINKCQAELCSTAEKVQTKEQGIDTGKSKGKGLE